MSTVLREHIFGKIFVKRRPTFDSETYAGMTRTDSTVHHNSAASVPSHSSHGAEVRNCIWR